MTEALQHREPAAAPDSPGEGGARSLAIDLAWLTLLSAVVFLWGLTDHGLTNWQEAQRALVAREMFETDEWIVPTVHGAPYIAKPPLIYWAQMVIANWREALGFEPFTDESEIRLTVAIAGWLGVLATCIGGRRLLRWRFGRGVGEAHLGAFLAALGLVSGVLYVRSSRIGELDVLLVPFVVTAVCAIDASWRRHDERARTAWGWVVVAVMASVGAALTKGPPALLVVALAGYGPILVRAAWRPPPRGDHPGKSSSFRPDGLAAAAGAIALALLSAKRVGHIADLFGVSFFAIVGAILGGGLARLSRGSAVREWFGAFGRTHPLFVLGVPVLVLWGWGRLVAARIGADRLAALAGAEVEDNLRLLVLDSPARNIGFMLYGVAPISIAAAAGAVWILWRRPSLESGRLTPPVWCGLGLVSFSAFGKGVARYLTPIWPGVALLGGMWLARRLGDEQKPQAARARAISAVVAVLIVAAIGQGWWYGAGRQRFFADRSPREIVGELRDQEPGARIVAFELDEPALSFYARAPVRNWTSREVEALGDWAETCPTDVLILARRETPDVVKRYGALVGPLRERGLTVSVVETASRYSWRGEGAPVVALQVSARKAP